MVLKVIVKKDSAYTGEIARMLEEAWIKDKYPGWMKRVALKIKAKRLIAEDRQKSIDLGAN